MVRKYKIFISGVQKELKEERRTYRTCFGHLSDNLNSFRRCRQQGVVTTGYLRHNDLGKPLNKMGKNELKKIDSFSPYGEAQHHAAGACLLSFTMAMFIPLCSGRAG